MQDGLNTAINRETGEQAICDRVFTVANGITFARLLLIPVSFALLIQGRDIEAAVLFAVTAATDFLDGLIARKTNTVTRLGQMLDPLVDRLLIVAAVIGLLVVGRIPLWIVILVLVRDLYVVAGGAYLIRYHGIRIPVSYVGKTAMWFLCIGFGGLILNMPIMAGLGWCDLPYFPGFNMEPCCAFIWVLYLGIALSLAVTVVYTKRGMTALSQRASKLEEVPHVRG